MFEGIRRISTNITGDILASNEEATLVQQVRGLLGESDVLVEIESADGGASGGHKGKLYITAGDRKLFAKPVGRVELLNYDTIQGLEESYLPEELKITPFEKLEIASLQYSLFSVYARHKASRRKFSKEEVLVMKSQHLRLKQLEKKAKAAAKYRESSKLSEFMPQRLGTVSVQGQQYLIMEDFTDDCVEQLADLKLAWIDYDEKDFSYNPIYDPKEYEFYGLEKNSFDAWQMRHQDKTAGYLLASGTLRFFNYSRSKENLQSALSCIAEEDLKTLISDLEKMKERLSKLPIGFIGASVILLHDELSGKVVPKLIDPAHMQVDPALQLEGVYSGDKTRFDKQKRSNIESISAIQKTIESLIAESRAGSPVHEVRGSQEVKYRNLYEEFAQTEKDHIKDFKFVLDQIEPYAKEIAAVGRKILEQHENLLKTYEETDFETAFLTHYTKEGALARAEFAKLYINLDENVAVRFNRENQGQLDCRSYLVKGIQRPLKYDLFAAQNPKVHELIRTMNMITNSKC